MAEESTASLSSARTSAWSALDSTCEGKWHAGRIAVIMVGLPATGKTFTARNLCRYLRWLGIRTRLFSVARYRNRVVGDRLNADFFDPSNDEYLATRTHIANEALSDMLHWLEGEEGGQVAILDASNTQPARRKIINVHPSPSMMIIYHCIFICRAGCVYRTKCKDSLLGMCL